MNPLEQAFIIPPLGHRSRASKGWSIWTFTDLDWCIMAGLPGTAYMRTYHCEDLEDGQRLLAECYPLGGFE